TRSREDPSRGPAGPPPGAPPTPSPPAEGDRVEEPPPPPPSEPDSGVQPGRWQRLLHEGGTLKKPVVHYLENGRLVSVEDGEVRIGVVGYNLSRAKDHQQVIMQAVRRIWGEGNKVLLVPVAPPPESAASGAAQANGGRAAALADEDPHPGAELKFMEDVLRDVDEIFGDAGGAGEAPSAPPA
ncbi:MAG: hypothetical protein ACE5IM_02130, partial [Nitrospinota bacterium]